jgi:hypothetical protein
MPWSCGRAETTWLRSTVRPQGFRLGRFGYPVEGGLTGRKHTSFAWRFRPDIGPGVHVREQWE